MLYNTTSVLIGTFVEISFRTGAGSGEASWNRSKWDRHKHRISSYLRNSARPEPAKDSRVQFVQLPLKPEWVVPYEVMPGGCELAAIQEFDDPRERWKSATLAGLPNMLLLIGRKRQRALGNGTFRMTTFLHNCVHIR